MAEPTKKHHYVLAALVAVALGLGGLALFARDANKNATENAQVVPAAGSEVAKEQAEVTTPEKVETTTAPQTSETAVAPKEIDEALKAELAKADPKWAEPRGNKIGNPNAPVKIKEFASLTCAHCAHFHNKYFAEIKQKYVDTGKVEFEFHEFPLNAPALDASLILNCLPKDRYYSFMTLLFETQEHWAFAQDYQTPLRQNAKLAGLSDKAFDACVKDEGKRKNMVENNMSASKKYKIESTPTFIINDGADMILGARPVEAFAEKIDPLLNKKK